ncbi:MAG TPA: SDR family NAD(P)-dependent oxidoreductase [Actinophytocola sp.]|jgi:NAD(P)-dependent dehydrogenase (short-subunit alcohol dehydrogenase family)|uniref:SDR family NAD(P)-dependent oxidoreductase n=1 Tax=Actinophytocola sp. TaxID=1872138 RepID=UPI002E08B2E5|nr:SDR family NAD(P)-dependent oxidoreductase [Actinophytocola sp.]
MSERITTPFGFGTTAFEVVAGVDLSGQRAVVTGATSGLGVETVRALAVAGAEVTIAARDVDAGFEVADEITAATGNKQVHVAPLDLADQESVRWFVSEWDGPLHILVNNAGVMVPPRTHTPHGWELQFAINHLGHFALTVGLHSALKAEGARVVNVSSIAHIRSPVVFEDIHFERRPYDALRAYGQSKTANALFGVEGSRRWGADGITMNAVMPGGIRTRLHRHIPPEVLEAMIEEAKAEGMRGKTAEQGAATTVLVAASPLLDGVSGRYFENCNEAGPHVPGTRTGVTPYAVDPEAAALLWQVSAATLGL